MTRIERRLAQMLIDGKRLDEYGWRAGAENSEDRYITFYRGPSYLRLHFSRFFYHLNQVVWWHDGTSRLNVWKVKSEEHGIFELVVDQIITGAADPTDRWLGNSGLTPRP